MATWKLAEYVKWVESGCEIDDSVIFLDLSFSVKVVNSNLIFSKLPNLQKIDLSYEYNYTISRSTWENSLVKNMVLTNYLV
jgi:hypothetical protein